MGFGIINWAFAIPAFYTIDVIGRRKLLLWTFPFLALFQILLGVSFAIPGAGHRWMALTMMFLFMLAYSPGEGPVPFVSKLICHFQARSS